MKFIQIPYPESPFEMMDTPITQSEWEKVMGKNPSHFKGKNNPVEMISWIDTQEFIQKLNSKNKKFLYRLPTEKEWEFACGRDPEKIDDYGWHFNNSSQKTHPVKKKKPNQFKLYDMLGNVWEWTSSLWSEDGSARVIRGGSWYNFPQYLRSASRNYDRPEYRYAYVGFRLVRTPVSLLSFTLSPSEKSETRVSDVEAILVQMEKCIQELKKDKMKRNFNVSK